MKSFHSSQLVSVCTRVVIEPGVYPQKLVCTPNLRGKGYMYPQFQNGVGMLMFKLTELQDPRSYVDVVQTNIILDQTALD